MFVINFLCASDHVTYPCLCHDFCLALYSQAFYQNVTAIRPNISGLFCKSGMVQPILCLNIYILGLHVIMPGPTYIPQRPLSSLIFPGFLWYRRHLQHLWHCAASICSLTGFPSSMYTHTHTHTHTHKHTHAHTQTHTHR